MDWTKVRLLSELMGTVMLSLVQDIVACGRKVYTMEPATTTTQKPSTTTPPSHREPCRPEEVSQQGCINRGECYVITIGGHRHTHCVCPDMWWGSRCQYFRPPESRNFFNARTANMAAGLSVVLLLVIVVIIAVYVYIRLRRHKKRGEPSPPLWSKERCMGTSSDRPDAVKIEDESQMPLNGGTSNNTHDMEMKPLSKQET